LQATQRPKFTRSLCARLDTRRYFVERAYSLAFVFRVTLIEIDQNRKHAGGFATRNVPPQIIPDKQDWLKKAGTKHLHERRILDEGYRSACDSNQNIPWLSRDGDATSRIG
jgi:hypothetical protein